MLRKIIIIFTNEGSVGGGRGRGGSLNHIHSLTRSPNGKDYGIFGLNHGPKTLLEHYILENHHGMIDKLFDYSMAGQRDIENMEAP